MTPTWSAALVGLAALVLLGGDARADKDPPPPPGPVGPITLPPAEEAKLDGGLMVTLVPFGEVPRATVTLVVRAGSATAGAHAAGVPDLLAALLKEGAGAKDAASLARAFGGAGGALRVTAGALETTLESDVLTERTADVIRLVAEVARRPALPAGELPRLKGELVRTIALRRGRAQELADEELRATVYAGHAYGARLPSPDEIQGYTLEQLRNFHDAQFGAARAHLYVVGRFDAPAALAAAREAFAGWGPGAPVSVPAVAPVSGRTVHLLDRPGASQAIVRVAMPVIDRTSPDWVPLEVTNTLLGAAWTSRIFMNLRESRGYATSPFSTLDEQVGTAVWVERADVMTADTGAAIREILKEIALLAKAPPPEAELDGVRRTLAGTFVLSMATREGIVANLRTVALHGLPADTLASYVPRLLAVTPADVQRVAARHLPADRMTLVVVGDKTIVERQIEPFVKAARSAQRPRR